jgi:hypothetical protein
MASGGGGILRSDRRADTAEPHPGQIFMRMARPVTITFPVANVTIEVRHQLGEVPAAYQVLSSTGVVTRAPGQDWTKELAYLRSSVAGDVVVLGFGVLKEEPINVNP